jgi:type IV pilus assembly protein PilN
MTIRINLLPHREEKKKQRRRDFAIQAALVALAGGLVVILVGQFIEGMISKQVARNNFIEQENKRLDEQIKEIASLKQEIEALKARQTAVEDLQSDRNLPTILLDELVRLTPEGIYLRSIKQEGLKVTVTGMSQSNERVSEYLRNLGGTSQWIGSPELVEIKAAADAVRSGSSAPRGSKLFDFNLNFALKRPGADKDKADEKSGVGVAKPPVKASI